LPAALILETIFERHEGTLRAGMTLRRSSDGGVLWSGAFPFTLDGRRSVNAAVDALAIASIQPVLEREANYLAYVRAVGTPAGPPPLNNPSAPGDPCSRSPFPGILFARDAQLYIGEYANGARSFDTHIPYYVGPREYPKATTSAPVKTGTPVLLRAPAFVQLEADTCVLTAYAGTAPVYPTGCIVPAKTKSRVDLYYSCAAKANPST